MNQNNRNRRMIRSKTKRLAQLLNTIEILEEGEGKNNEEEIVEENEFFYEGGGGEFFQEREEEEQGGGGGGDSSGEENLDESEDDENEENDIERLLDIAELLTNDELDPIDSRFEFILIQNNQFQSYLIRNDLKELKFLDFRSKIIHISHKTTTFNPIIVILT